MNRIVKTHYPAAKLPPDLREGLRLDAEVSVIVEEVERPERSLTIDDIWASREPPFRTAEEIDAVIRQHRDEWDER